MQEQIKLTYFDGPGRAEPIRLLFTIGDVKFEDERLSFQDFGKAKAEGKFKYNQVPVLEIDGKQYAQSQGMLYYAAQRSGLFPKDPFQLVQIEQVLQNHLELQSKITPTFKMKDDAEKKAAREQLAKEWIPLWLERIEQAIVDNGSTGYISGKELTYGDVVLFCNISIYKSGRLEGIPTTITDKYTQIQKVVENVRQHPKVKSYYAKAQ